VFRQGSLLAVPTGVSTRVRSFAFRCASTELGYRFVDFFVFSKGADKKEFWCEISLRKVESYAPKGRDGTTLVKLTIFFQLLQIALAVAKQLVSCWD